MESHGRLPMILGGVSRIFLIFTGRHYGIRPVSEVKTREEVATMAEVFGQLPSTCLGGSHPSYPSGSRGFEGESERRITPVRWDDGRADGFARGP
jgi:hypothetical protein